MQHLSKYKVVSDPQMEALINWRQELGDKLFPLPALEQTVLSCYGSYDLLEDDPLRWNNWLYLITVAILVTYPHIPQNDLPSFLPHSYFPEITLSNGIK